MVSLLQGMDPATVDLETALRLLTLPRDLGEHPEDPNKEHVHALLGRYGPYVKWGTDSRSIPAGTSVLDIDLGQAVAFLVSGSHGGLSIKKGGLWWLTDRVRDGDAEVVVRAVVSPDLL